MFNMAPVVQKLDSTIHWINHYPVAWIAQYVLSSLTCCIAIYLLGSTNLSLP